MAITTALFTCQHTYQSTSQRIRSSHGHQLTFVGQSNSKRHSLTQMASNDNGGAITSNGASKRGQLHTQVRSNPKKSVAFLQSSNCEQRDLLECRSLSAVKYNTNKIHLNKKHKLHLLEHFENELEDLFECDRDYDDEKKCDTLPQKKIKISETVSMGL